MTIKEAMQRLLAGEKLRCNRWSKESYVYLDEHGHLCADCGAQARECISELNEVYVAPKPKQRLWLWRYKRSYQTDWMVHVCLYTKERAKEFFAGADYEAMSGPYEVPCE